MTILCFMFFLINNCKVALLLFRNQKRFRRNNFTSNSGNLQGKQRHLQTKWEPSKMAVVRESHKLFLSLTGEFA
jgi:hypothetical protein